MHLQIIQKLWLQTCIRALFGQFFLTPGSDVSVSESGCAQYDHLSPGLYLLVEMHMDSCGHHG